MTKRYNTQTSRIADAYMEQEIQALRQARQDAAVTRFLERIKREAAALLAEGYAPTDCALLNWDALNNAAPVLNAVIPFEEAKQTRPMRFLLGNLEVGVI